LARFARKFRPKQFHKIDTRSVLPESARVVGVQSESGLFQPHIMTLAEFLEASRHMEKIHAIRYRRYEPEKNVQKCN
jgi:hypothetical protein